MADAPVSYDLGIDTASERVSLALVPLDAPALGDVPSRILAPESTVSRELIGAIADFLAEVGAHRTQVARIAVGVGPGQYAAVRTGIAVAQGLALALDVPLAGVGRLEADAARVGSEGGPPVVAVHATRTGPAWAAYERDPAGAPREVTPPALTSYEECAARAPHPAIWTGELTEELSRARDAEGRTGDTVAPEPSEPRAVAIVRIARVREAFGDPAGVDAVYLRPPPITRPRTQ